MVMDGVLHNLIDDETFEALYSTLTLSDIVLREYLGKNGIKAVRQRKKCRKAN
jgi:hypothetical protein